MWILQLLFALIIVSARFQHTIQTHGGGGAFQFRTKFNGFASKWQRRVLPGISDDCRQQIVRFMQELQNDSPWAVGMIEASSKMPAGLLSGNDYQFGDYDQCISIHSDDRLIHGKYCLADIHISPNKDNRNRFRRDFSLSYDPYNSFLDKFKASTDPSQKQRNILHSGICVPELCSSGDIERGVSALINGMVNDYGYNASVKVPEKACSTGSASGNDRARKIFWGIMLTMMHVVLLSTAWDLLRAESKSEKKNNLAVVAESFSIRQNVMKLTSSNPNGEFDAFHGMKTMSMTLIILGHRCMASFGGPVYNAEFLEKGYRSFSTILLLNGILIVDTFFLIGGFLTFVALHGEYEKGRKIATLQVFLHRWLRITPEYMLVVFFYGYVLESLGSGPIWSVKVGREAEKCRDNWWTNLLYVNNYVNNDRLCMFQAWYVACDMHYIIISPIIVKLVLKMGKNGWQILLGLILASSLSVSAITYFNRYDGIMRIYYGTLEDLASSKYFSEVYIKSHNRITPYLSGMAAAYIYLNLKQSNMKLSKRTLWFISVPAFILGLSSICGAWVFYIPGREYNIIENTMYASLHRVFWSLSIGWTAVACARNSFGIIQPILTSRIFIPFSKLTFGAFLVHGAIQLYTTASLRSPEYMNYSKLFWMTCGDAMLSFFFAFILYLVVEAPMKGIQKVLFSR